MQLPVILLGLLMCPKGAESVSMNVSPSSFVKENNTVTFTCTETREGVSLILWYRDFTALLPVVFTTSPCYVDKSDHNTVVISERYQFSCEVSGSSTYVATLTIPAENVTEHEHGSQWRCRARGNGFNVGSEAVTLAVLVPVGHVYLQTPSNARVEYIPPGGEAILTCTTDSSRPQARIEWYMDNVNVTDDDGISSNYSGESVRGSKLSTFSTHVLSKGNGNITVMCKAANIAGMYAESNTITAVFIALPTLDPVITGYTSVSSYYVGDVVTLTCSQSGGNPPPLLVWEGVCAGGNPTQQSNGSFVQSRMNIAVTESMNQGRCVCRSTQSLYPIGTSQSVSLVLIVKSPQPPDPPSDSYISMITKDGFSLKWKAGYNGGMNQIFVIVVIKEETNITNIMQESENNKTENYEMKINNLMSKTRYKAFLYSENNKGNSSFTNENFFNVYTFTKECVDNTFKENSSYGIGFASGAGTCIFLTICVVIALYFLRILRIGKTPLDSAKNNRTTYENTNTSSEDRNPYSELQTGQDYQYIQTDVL